MSLTVNVHNRYRINRQRGRRGAYPYDDAVSGARLYLYPVADQNARVPISALPMPAMAQTNRNGRGRLDIPDRTGSYILRIVPHEWTLDDVGPGLGSAFTAIPNRIYRPLDVNVRVEASDRSLQVNNAVVQTGIANGEIASQAANSVNVLLQPVWMSDYSGRRHTRTNIDLIVLHLTSGSDPYGAVRKISSKAGAHYLILKQTGQIIKFLRESTTGGHAGSGGRSGNSYWDGDTNINARSIGIEMENVKASEANPDFSEAQYVSLMNLLKQLVATHGIDRKRIIGHSDVAVWLDIKVWDPGLKFDWPRLDQNGYGLIGPGGGSGSFRSLIAAGSSQVYGGLFKGQKDDPLLRLGDDDATSTYGGQVVRGVTGTPIMDILTDLSSIGYWVGANGASGKLSNSAVRSVMHFQHHFFATRRASLPQNEAGVRIDAETALMIRDAALIN